MKPAAPLRTIALLFLCTCITIKVCGQTSAFSYTGKLLQGTQSAGGLYEFQFRLSSSATANTFVGATLTNSLGVTNGTFTATLDFGAGTLDGTRRWLDVSVRTSAVGQAFTPLTPRVAIATVPQAVFAGTAALANSVNGSNIAPGSITSAQLSTGIWAAITNSNYAGSFSGDGSGLTNLNGNVLQFGTPTSLSLNLTSLPNLQAAAAQNRQIRIMWIGDSIGAETMPSVAGLFSKFSRSGLNRGAPFTPFPYVWGELAGPATQVFGREYWGYCAVLSNTAKLSWAGGSYGGYLTGNVLQVWYIGAATNGTFTAEITTNGVIFTTVGTIDSTKATGLALTNIPVPFGSYAFRFSAVGPGTVWLPMSGSTVLNSTNFGFCASVCNAGGRTLDDFMAMGSNNIRTLFSNINPTVVVCQQLKAPETRTNWTAIRSILSNCCPNTDVVLVSVHPTAYDSVAALKSVFDADRSVAVTNGWAYVDVWSAIGSYSNAAASRWSDDGVHYNTAGQQFEGDELIRELNLMAYIVQQGTATAK